MQKFTQMATVLGKRSNHLMTKFYWDDLTLKEDSAAVELPLNQIDVCSGTIKRLKLYNHSQLGQHCITEGLPKLQEWPQSHSFVSSSSPVLKTVVPVVDNLLLSLSEDGQYNLGAEVAGLAKTKSQNCVPPKAVQKDTRGSINHTTSGVSMLEFLTKEQIKEHILGLRKLSYQPTMDDWMNAAAHAVSENTCQLCREDKHFFAPAPLYCLSCEKFIKAGAIYYKKPDNAKEKHLFCASCFGATGASTVKFEGTYLPKKDFEKRMNNVGTEEPWVQCDMCGAWQHQICSLYNAKKDVAGNAEYICPLCFVRVVDNGDRATPIETSIFSAKDIPQTKLSDHMEQRLHQQLKRERKERADAAGKTFEEVPGAEDLTLRVVSSLPKKVEVNKLILETLGGASYPSEIPYESKVILLFQKIGGVDVLIFGMYVQEFGSDCGSPNQRQVYISYIDSVKYFQPDIMTIDGESLRTFVYHEILIGYLEYCKLRGFVSCHIWSCPPLKGDDYLLYCHPEFQKSPKAQKLRKWYQSMLVKASKEKIVESCTNLFDKYFTPNGRRRSKISASKLPYFEGVYWTTSAEMILKEIERKYREVEKNGEGISRRALKSLAYEEHSNTLLMQKLGEMIRPMKDDFIVAHLQLECTNCKEFILSGRRWSCGVCKNFQICDRCHKMKRIARGTCIFEPVCNENHLLSQVDCAAYQTSTKDEEIRLDSCLFEDRQQFLEFCKENNHQFDSLRRAKHSSMMILHHLSSHMLYNSKPISTPPPPPPPPAAITANPPAAAAAAAAVIKDDKELEWRALWSEDFLKLLVHASRCPSPESHLGRHDRACRKMKGLFIHARRCRNGGASKGCRLCRIAWTGLVLHATSCKQEGGHCRVPWCTLLKQKKKLLH